jgi:hypothetical protein
LDGLHSSRTGVDDDEKLGLSSEQLAEALWNKAGRFSCCLACLHQHSWSRFMQKKNRMKNDNGSGSCLQQLEPRVVTWQLPPFVYCGRVLGF